jgi:hypothetical protein
MRRWSRRRELKTVFTADLGGPFEITDALLEAAPLLRQPEHVRHGPFDVSLAPGYRHRAERTCQEWLHVPAHHDLVVAARLLPRSPRPGCSLMSVTNRLRKAESTTLIRPAVVFSPARTLSGYSADLAFRRLGYEPAADPARSALGNAAFSRQRTASPGGDSGIPGPGRAIDRESPTASDCQRRSPGYATNRDSRRHMNQAADTRHIMR